MNDNKLKHLEFIQNTITRMSTNSFIIKGWVITIVSALFALAEKDSNKNYILLSYFAIPVFWYLNGYFLKMERKYRKLYDDVRQKEENDIDFSMNTDTYNQADCSTLSSMFSLSIFPLYIFMIIVTLLIMFLI
ncbi:hypothetical protein [Elizabethkingia meningoseptica]|uniref:hypothetical protein n=1 Tax=Elizabethkingia meningoseptica TaxID=238 RepID=UPI000841502A|nr:hypothetical protein [Elizabethkingia meningoseptica]ODM54337.1 hypothetical protein BES09_09095 [Elizabethkingia meningoseptica]OHT29562.1 hypothetical protein BFF93_09100 [Elizabethkingia meningoseptica]OPC08405.1 hypothetical protein BAX93_12980 [Elizabethkingia meningoseptica]